MTRDLASSWGVEQPGDSPVVRVVMCQFGAGKGIPQEDGALLSLYETFSGDEAPKKLHFCGLNAPCLGGFGDFRVWGMAKLIPMASRHLSLWLMPMCPGPAPCYHFMELLGRMQKKKIQHGLNTKGQEGKRPGEGRGHPGHSQPVGRVQ